jgi:hypothetical protein
MLSVRLFLYSGTSTLRCEAITAFLQQMGQLVISGDITKYRYDDFNEEIIGI